MIYFDNAATTIQKPPEVSQAVAQAIGTFGNAGRSFHTPAMQAARAVYGARQEIARLAGLQNPLQVAFTSGATESLNLVLSGLIRPEDHVITTVLEHNSVLRPLYQTGCELSYLSCDDRGMLLTDRLPALLRKNTRFVVCTHGSNLVGSVTDTGAVQSFCHENGLGFILDASQTMGSIQTNADLADVLCFTGHKALLGPQGTGGIIVQRDPGFRPVKTGGSGSDSFRRSQRTTMPDIFEAGTANAHGLAGLAAGIRHLNYLGMEAIRRHKQALLTAFLEGISNIPQIRLYGSHPDALPVAALNVGDLPAEETTLWLWENRHIATRSGSHCAPLLHRFFHTEKRGMVRFSFGLYNSLEEVETTVEALAALVKKKG